MGKEFFTADQLEHLWQSAFLPSIRKGVNAEPAKINDLMKALELRFQEIARNPSFQQSMILSLKKYDTLTEAMKTVKSQIATTEANLKIAESRINDSDNSTSRHEHPFYDVDCKFDELSWDDRGVEPGTYPEQHQLVARAGFEPGIQRP